MLKEDDITDMQGLGNHLDFGARIYDSRLGRWLSIDPKAEAYPGWSPYNFALNNPIFYIDIAGELPGVPTKLQMKYAAAVVKVNCPTCYKKLNDGNYKALWLYSVEGNREGWVMSNLKGAFGEIQVAQIFMYGSYFFKGKYSSVKFNNNQSSKAGLRHDIYVELKPNSAAIKRNQKPVGTGSQVPITQPILDGSLAGLNPITGELYDVCCSSI